MEDDCNGVSSLVENRLQLDADVESVPSEVDYGESDDEGAAEHFDEDEEARNKEHFDELGALGFALVITAMLLPEFDTLTDKAKDCIAGCWMKPLQGACKPADREALKACMWMFFTKRPLLQSTPPKEDNDIPRVQVAS